MIVTFLKLQFNLNAVLLHQIFKVNRMTTVFIVIVAFLMLLAIFDLVVGVSNDAVNFMNSAIGAKVGRYWVVVAIAAIGVFVGAIFSNGMMDVARHGVLTPTYFNLYDVMCIFLAVMITDVILLDVYNTLGMPTSTTVSLVFELLGGAFALAIVKVARGAVGADGTLLTLNELLNSDKALTMILAIFLSVAVAFVFGFLVQWLSRLLFTFTYNKNSQLKVGIFAGIAITCILWFLLIKGLKGSTLQTPELMEFLNNGTWTILGMGFLIFSLLMILLAYLKVNVLKIVVLFGTFALAMAFAGNDLVNFVGIPLTGLDALQTYLAAGATDPHTFMMGSLNESAQTPLVYLLIAGTIMVLSLVFSKKSHNVVKTSVDLSRQDVGDEMFGSSKVARTLVRSTNRIGNNIASRMPQKMLNWIDTRFNTNEAVIEQGAAFDLIRASVNLVLAGVLVALGTSLKLPLSTTYVTFMVAMGTSLADRAWSRESAVFRITGVLSVIGGWFITAGVAFVACFLVTNLFYFGSYPAMLIMIVVAMVLLFNSNKKFSKSRQSEADDVLFKEILKSNDEDQTWDLLCAHVRENNEKTVSNVKRIYQSVTDGFFYENYSKLKQADSLLDDVKKDWKRQRRRELIGIRKSNKKLVIERNTWYFLSNNSSEQLLYCVKRAMEPCEEHVGNNFTPLSMDLVNEFLPMRETLIGLFDRTEQMLQSNDYSLSSDIRNDAIALQATISNYRKEMLESVHAESKRVEVLLVFINLLQESMVLLSTLRHMIRGMVKFQEGEPVKV